MNILEGKYTVETFARKYGLARQSALNLLSRLKKKGLVTTSGGGPQKRIYTISRRPQLPDNGFYALVNKYSPEKLVPAFKHRVVGRYTVERAIIDGVLIGDERTLSATMHLFRHVRDWKSLLDLAKRRNVVAHVRRLYLRARTSVRCRAMPARYL